jgi:hypothetical protein
MSCGPAIATFRLLDAFVGWDEYDATHLSGLDKPEGLQLAQKDPDAVHPGEVLARIPPPRLARGCGPCDWYLVTPQPPVSRLRIAMFAPVNGYPCGVQDVIQASWSQRLRLLRAGPGWR